MSKEENNTDVMPLRPRVHESAEAPDVIELPGEPKEEPEEESEAVGSYQVVLSVVLQGDLSGIEDDPAHRNLVNGMTLLADNIRNNFPGKIVAAEVTDFIIGAEPRAI